MILRCFAHIFCIFLLTSVSQPLLLGAPRRPRKPSIPPATHCMSGKVKYSISQSWYPVLIPCGYVECIKCSCKLEGNAAKVVCNNLYGSCPGGYLKPGDCCRTCPGLSRPVKRSTDRSCTLKNREHSHGSVWKVDPSNAADLDPNQCTECSCWDGFVSCAIRTCPKPVCSNPVSSLTSCCPVCPERPMAQPKTAGCSSLGRGYKEGETWHPMLQPYRTKCILCTCKNSVVRCDKVKCEDGANCNPRCCTCTAPTISKQTPALATLPPTPPLAEFPDCYFSGHGVRRHNSSWIPTIAGISSNCFECTCLNSEVRCEKIICPKSYSCQDPVNIPGKCCKVCRGMANRVQSVRLGRRRRLCGLGKTRWLVYNFTSTLEPNSDPNQASGQFALEEIAPISPRVELHLLAGNRTHLSVVIDVMDRTRFEKWVNESEARKSQRPIGVLREGRRKKIKEKEQAKCVLNCHLRVRQLMDVLGKRSRSCRPPVTLTALKEGL
ncbi:chordin-like protein 1 isoform X2 [Nematostella vectensis]|uniref:chordin-like protein 1 isoform X2 n=1 Tax=Nematostella vectensis TaxID=45351 RepID=UPI0013904DA7|nr:chordin-like protein 1 isoform X2 [Nematostella vectensis]